MTKPRERSARTTVLIAGAANVFVAAVKVVAGVLTASSALLAEAARSAADTLNQAFLLASIRQGRRPGRPKAPIRYRSRRGGGTVRADRPAAVGAAVNDPARVHRSHRHHRRKPGPAAARSWRRRRRPKISAGNAA